MIYRCKCGAYGVTKICPSCGLACPAAMCKCGNPAIGMRWGCQRDGQEREAGQALAKYAPSGAGPVPYCHQCR